MTVPSLFGASYKRLKFRKVNNGTEPRASPFPSIPPSGIAAAVRQRLFQAESVQTSHHPAELQLEKNGSSFEFAQARVNLQKCYFRLLINRVLDLNVVKW